ncbi:MAG: hypothetical protein MRY78_09940 [Saprospiraceae bacterium]|nr:hypothetical protein [Saprospiraceae bacterium]
MHYKVTIKKEKEKEFLKVMDALESLGAVLEVDKIESPSADSEIPKRGEVEELSEEFTSDLASTEYLKRYRDLVD